MSPVFSINFRREAYLREVARTRRRVLALGLWLAYFGVLSVVLGLYGLNCVSLLSRTKVLERQATRLHQLQMSGQEWRPEPSTLVEVDRHVANPRLWRDRLARLPQILPTGARLTSVQFNPDNLSGGAPKLVLMGEFRSTAGQDRMQNIMAFVGSLSRDSVFARGYSNVRLASTRTAADGAAEFVVECR